MTIVGSCSKLFWGNTFRTMMCVHSYMYVCLGLVGLAMWLPWEASGAWNMVCSPCCAWCLEDKTKILTLLRWRETRPWISIFSRDPIHIAIMKVLVYEQISPLQSASRCMLLSMWVERPWVAKSHLVGQCMSHHMVRPHGAWILSHGYKSNRKTDNKILAHVCNARSLLGNLDSGLRKPLRQIKCFGNKLRKPLRQIIKCFGNKCPFCIETTRRTPLPLTGIDGTWP